MQTVQQRIIKQLLDAIDSTQTLPWRRGFKQMFPSNLATGETYRGQNVFMLLAAQAMLSYRYTRWIGFVQFQQWRETHRELWASDIAPYIKGRGTQIVKVSLGKERVKTDYRGTPVYKRAAVAVAEAEPETERPQYLTLLTVFNADQVQGLKADALKPQTPTISLSDAARLGRDTLLGAAQRMGVRVQVGEYLTPFYMLSSDQICSPDESLYLSDSEIVADFAHELVHATGKRLGRKLSGDKGSKGYAEEELVAEMGAALLLAHFGMEDTRSIDNAAAYVQGWSRFIQNTPDAFVRAASNAQKAVDFILG